VGKVKILGIVLIVGLLISLVFIGGCIPGGEAAGETTIWPMIIFLAVMFGLMYFVMIRPQRKRQKEQQQLQEELQRGDRVVTAGGIYGVVESLSEDSIVIKVESGATMRVARASVSFKKDI